VPETTTTTTTLAPALKDVITETVIIASDGTITQVSVSSASDNDDTQDSVFANALSFGAVAPGETSQNLIITLNIPFSRAITNIKLGLMETGGITFGNSIFGLATSPLINVNIDTASYFQGINTTDLASNSYNISIPNKTQTTSDYVYLNITLPDGNTLGTGVIRFKWFFDYAD